MYYIQYVCLYIIYVYIIYIHTCIGFRIKCEDSLYKHVQKSNWKYYLCVAVPGDCGV